MPTEIQAGKAGGTHLGSVTTKVEREALDAAARLATAFLGDALSSVEAGIRLADIEARLLETAASCAADTGIAVSMEAGRKLSGTLVLLLEDRAAPVQSLEGRRLEEGELLAVRVTGSVSGHCFQRSEVRLVGTGDDEQAHFLDHLVQATQWMAEALRPGVESEFVRTESRGRVILPRAHGIGHLPLEEPVIESNRRFTVSPGQVLVLEPLVISPAFGTACADGTVLVTQGGAETLGGRPRVGR